MTSLSSKVLTYLVDTVWSYYWLGFFSLFFTLFLFDSKDYGIKFGGALWMGEFAGTTLETWEYVRKQSNQGPSGRQSRNSGLRKL